MFGKYSFMELIEEKKRLENPNRKNRIYFSGTLFNHNDDEFKIYRNRNIIFNEISNFLYLPRFMNNVPFDDYLNDIHNSSFSLDLNGVGEPNKRTFEILSQGSLRISEYNNLKWCFDDNFCEETIFKNSQDFKLKIRELIDNPDLYNKCLKKQNEIVEKYYNKNYLHNYLLEIIQK
jgi:spore maturation protein CgeB